MQILRWITSLIAARTVTPAVVETTAFGDHDRRFKVVLDPFLPDDAYQQLFALDLSRTPAGVLTWDYQSRGWRVG